MSRHIDYSDPDTPTRPESLESVGALPVVQGDEYEPTDADPLPPWLVRSLLFTVKANHEKWNRKWTQGIECEYRLANCGQLPLCYRRTV